MGIQNSGSALEQLEMLNADCSGFPSGVSPEEITDSLGEIANDFFRGVLPTTHDIIENTVLAFFVADLARKTLRNKAHSLLGNPYTAITFDEGEVIS